jgi:Zn finger protein HypA/HybF involved in hydrogenase expression
MPRKAFCTTCSRTVYIDLDDSLVCPVCSSPILEAIDIEDEPELERTSDNPAQSPERK